MTAQLSPPPVGFWREHLPYNSAIDVAIGKGLVYCATPYSLYTVDPASSSIQRLSRITGLAETGISAISYDEPSGKLFIAYSNSNIDIIFRNDIINVPDLKRDDIPGDKRIYNIFSRQGNYYLSTGIGVIIIDGDRYEIKDSWFIGSNGAHAKVNGFAADGNFFYAAMDEGLKRIPVNSPDPANYNNWSLISSLPGCEDVVAINDKVIVQRNDSLYSVNGTTLTPFYADGAHINSCNVSGNQLLLAQTAANGLGQVTILNGDGSVSRVLSQMAPISLPRKAVLLNNEPWLADQYGGLSHFSGANYDQFKPNSPEATSSGDLTVYNNVLYATAGSVNDAWNYQLNSNGIFILSTGQWTNVNRFRYQQIDSLYDYITIAIDPADQTAWTGSFGGGLLHLRGDNSFEIFKQGYLGATVGDPGSYRVSGLAFDGDDNLWISNFGSTRPLRVRGKDGGWSDFSIPFLINENSLAQVVIDDNGYKWIIAAKTGNVICYDHGTDIRSTGDDHWKKLGPGPGNGNLPNAEVRCLAKDRNGFIWVGTSSGIAVFQCTSDLFTAQACDAIWPIVQQGNFAGYLFNGQEVRSIAVDGADRKWVATRNGVWLISAGGDKVIYNFTEANSPLLSNDVRKIAIDGSTGEVFFATINGICSFRSTATEGGESNREVLVFPNPVPPGYSGSIAIRGLVNNAIVKITELNGRLVYQTRAYGGQAVWDGHDYRGRQISTGVYLVLISDDGSAGSSKKETAAARIIFIGK